MEGDLYQSIDTKVNTVVC